MQPFLLILSEYSHNEVLKVYIHLITLMELFPLYEDEVTH